jgi:hypothetical protein
MKQDEIEKAWAIMSMHNSELLLHVADLEKRLRTQSILAILKARIKYFFGSRYD